MAVINLWDKKARGPEKKNKIQNGYSREFLTGRWLKINAVKIKIFLSLSLAVGILIIFGLENANGK